MPGIYLLATLPRTGDGRLGRGFSTRPVLNQLARDLFCTRVVFSELFQVISHFTRIYLLATLPETGDGRLGSDLCIGPFVSELFQVISYFTPN